MKLLNKKQGLILAAVFCFFASQFFAQKVPECVKAATTIQPTHVLVSAEKLHAFYKNFQDEANFKNTKIVKSELAYYLLATESDGTRVFAFELETKGKKLYLNREFPVQICSEGILSLDTFLQQDGKITGCRMGSHSSKQI